ncbi:hypothetical protein ADL21_23005 [Streptomyces albus subsp. albus]|nr:hypothetical protein ADL21_23005 [Streptomyces albus subsp. albus]
MGDLPMGGCLLDLPTGGRLGDGESQRFATACREVAPGPYGAMGAAVPRPEFRAGADHQADGFPRGM